MAIGLLARELAVAVEGLHVRVVLGDLVELAVARMQDTVSPMPPKTVPPATADQIKALSDWIAGGMPNGDCNIDVPPDTTFEGAPACNSGTLYTGGDGLIEPPPV